jgi:hypothetical protein
MAAAAAKKRTRGSLKSPVIESLFDERWDKSQQKLINPSVTQMDIRRKIQELPKEEQSKPELSDRNIANFFKDFIRRKNTANANWPASIWERGYTARQVTGNNQSFEFIVKGSGQQLPFPSFAAPSDTTQRLRIESVSLPLASRMLGRRDETWLMQVVVRLRILEAHLALVSRRNWVQIDHLQMSVKHGKREIDGLFLGLERTAGDQMRQVMICCEAKGRNDDLLEEQIVGQVRVVLEDPAVTQAVALPIGIKAVGPSQIYIAEFDEVTSHEVGTLESLSIVSDALFELVPQVPGIGR